MLRYTVLFQEVKVMVVLNEFDQVVVRPAGNLLPPIFQVLPVQLDLPLVALPGGLGYQLL